MIELKDIIHLIPKETLKEMVKVAKKAKPGKPGILLMDENFIPYKKK